MRNDRSTQVVHPGLLRYREREGADLRRFGRSFSITLLVSHVMASSLDPIHTEAFC